MNRADKLRIMRAMSPAQAIRKARRLIVGFILTDPRLAPVLLEIDLALSRANDDLTDDE